MLVSFTLIYRAACPFLVKHSTTITSEESLRDSKLPVTGCLRTKGQESVYEIKLVLVSFTLFYSTSYMCISFVSHFTLMFARGTCASWSSSYYCDASSSSCCYVASYLASIPSFRRLLLTMLCLWEVSLSEGGEELCLSICTDALSSWASAGPGCMSARAIACMECEVGGARDWLHSKSYAHI